MKPRMGYQRIQSAMRENEKAVLKVVRFWNRQGEGYRPTIGGNSISWLNAIDRLREKGKIRYSVRRARANYNMSGYWIVR